MEGEGSEPPGKLARHFPCQCITSGSWVLAGYLRRDVWVLVLDCTPTPRAPSPCTAWNQAILFALNLLSCSPGCSTQPWPVCENGQGALITAGPVGSGRWCGVVVVGAGNEAGDWDLGSAPHVKHLLQNSQWSPAPERSLNLGRMAQTTPIGPSPFRLQGHQV